MTPRNADGEERLWWCIDHRHHAGLEILVSASVEGAERSHRVDGFQDCGYDGGPCDEGRKLFGTRADAERAMANSHRQGGR